MDSTGESLLDILGDMFSDLNKNGGAGMAKDFALLLEGLEGNAMVTRRTAFNILFNVKLKLQYRNRPKERSRSGLLRA